MYVFDTTQNFMDHPATTATRPKQKLHLMPLNTYEHRVGVGSIIYDRKKEKVEHF